MIGRKKIVIGVVVLLVILFGSFFIKNNDSTQYQVIQTPFGQLYTYDKPGMFFVFPFSQTTTYDKYGTEFYSKWPDESSKSDTSVDVRFADGGIGYVSMGVRWEKPVDEAQRLLLHKVFRNDRNFRLALIEQNANQAGLVAASMFTAEGSYRQRAQFMSSITDQTMNGIYETRSKELKNADTNDTVVVQEVIKNDEGIIKRKPRDLEKYGVRISNVDIKDIDYHADVQSKIDQKLAKAQEAELAKYEAEKARQETLVNEEKGRQEVVKAKYEEEQKKAKAEVAAQQQLAVAKLAQQQAQVELETKRLKAEQTRVQASAEAEAKRKLMEADGALQAKLDTVLAINKVWADAYTKQRPTPDIVFGDTNGKSAGLDANSFMQIMTLNAAKQLQVDLNVKKH